ncbi:MAG TPA: hypothetical protein VFM10_00085 [Terriglobales bacterium]|jgi:hypothetical protein|nr:hypothetical protein [Terriglobales bacterium]
MPVLILALVSLVIFIGTLILMGVANAAEERQLKRMSALVPGAPFRVLSVCDAFESEYAILWETQVPALRLIASEGAKGVAIQRLHAFYERSSRRYPELYDGSSFQQWLGFLEQSELITATEHRVAITREGLEFLKYRVPTGVAA